MRFLVLSDLHTEFSAFRPPPGLDHDAVILAGDIGNGTDTPPWASDLSIFGRDKPIIVVPGNHEFYGALLPSRRQELQVVAKDTPNVHLLDPGQVLLDSGKVRVLGCTLWTDFRAPVVTGHVAESDQRYAMELAWRHMKDYRGEIGIATASGRIRALRPSDTLGFHEVEAQWLLSKLREPHEGVTVVVTHHAPALGSTTPARADDSLTPAYVNDLPDDYFQTASLWVHGHTHVSLDYWKRGTRVVCNPRGNVARGNPDFDPWLVIDVPTPG